ncbi:enterobactin synthetase component D [Streptomyces sp. SAI-041]|nr:enterobactin synthetase component D [Streptomyces sp. SAI-041]
MSTAEGSGRPAWPGRDDEEPISTAQRSGRPVWPGPAGEEPIWAAQGSRTPVWLGRNVDEEPQHRGKPLPGRLGGDLAALGPLLLAAGLGLGVAAVSEPGAEPAGPAEAAAAASMPERRRREFLAGRRAARRALRAVGLDCGEIPRSGRLPVFPPGRAASISHSAGIAVAVAPDPGLPLPAGCDLELRPLPRAAARLVLCADEEPLLAVWSVTALFSAKESAWKALAMAEGGLRDLRASSCGDGLRVCLRADPGRAVRVRVVPIGAAFGRAIGAAGVFSYVTGLDATRG